MTGPVAQLGALGVLLLMIPESACLPVPSEVTLMAAGFGVHQGLLGFPATVAAATAGNLIGSLLAYLAGRMGGGSVAGRGPAVIRRCQAILDRHGERAVFLARLLPLARSFVSLPAGAARVPLARFIPLTIAGCAIWSAAFVLAGDRAGSAWQGIAGTAGQLGLLVGALVVAALWWEGRRLGG
jgi:membrane protein DedA with SNARE-associated domain